MRFSLIVATYGRSEVLYDLFESLCKQTFKDFEVIIVDQNASNEVELIVSGFTGILNIVYLKTPLKGLSRARNIGINHSKGEILSFPDDDCVYPDFLLQRVNEKFNTDTLLEFCSGKALDVISGNPLEMKWARKKTEITFGNIFNTVISISIFVKKRVVVPFDEEFGAGAKYGSAEESDFVINLLKNKAKGIYFPDEINPLHPSNKINGFSQIIRSKNITYALGLGAFFRKHASLFFYTGLIKVFVLSMLIRPLGGIILGIIRIQTDLVKISSINLRYRWIGFFNYKKKNENIGC